MAVWMVRAERYSESKKFALDNSFVVVGWEKLPDMSAIESAELFRIIFRSLRYKLEHYWI